MALFGVEQAQGRLQSLILEMVSPLLDESKKLTLEESKSLQKVFFAKLQSLIESCGDPSKLNLDIPVILNPKMNITFPQVVESFNLALIKEGLLHLKEKHHFNYSVIAKTPATSNLLTDVVPAQLYKKGKLLQDNHGQYFVFKQALGGRGQAGSANFYQKAQQQFLIKEDTAETCLLEGTAYFVKDAHLLPLMLGDAINFATVATLVTEENASQTVSVQPRVMSSDPQGSVCPWDELVFGVKRNPKTIWSFESWYPDYIKRSIAALNSFPQWQLAASTVAGDIVGDESKHIGQEMAILDSHKNIIGIKRIDLGARERSAVQRQANHDQSPYHASLLYQESIWKGKQMGKDYVSYLLAEPGLKRKVNYIWMNMDARFQKEGELAELIRESAKVAFIRQHQAIPEEHKEQVLEQVLATLNKGAKEPLQFPLGAKPNEKLAFLADHMAQIDASRTLSMLNEVKADFKKTSEEYIAQVSSKIEGKYQHAALDALRIRDSYLQGKDDGKVSEVLHTLDEAILSTLKMAMQNANEKLSYEQIQLYAHAALFMLDAMQLSLMDNPHKKAEIEALEKHIKKYNTLLQSADYCLSTKSKDKISDVVKLMMNAATNDENQFAKSIQEDINFIAKLSTQSNIASSAIGTVVIQRTKGFYLLQNIFKRYGLDDSLLVLTPAQIHLKNQILEKNFKNVKNIVSDASFAVDDALAPNVNGSTSLHLLMQYADNNDAYEAITQIMLKSRGTVYNSNLSPLDADKLEPLDYLVKNKNAQELLSYLKAKKYEIPGKYYGSNKYQLTDFFVKEKLEEVEAKAAQERKRLSL